MDGHSRILTVYNRYVSYSELHRCHLHNTNPLFVYLDKGIMRGLLHLPIELFTIVIELPTGGKNDYKSLYNFSLVSKQWHTAVNNRIYNSKWSYDGEQHSTISLWHFCVLHFPTDKSRIVFEKATFGNGPLGLCIVEALLFLMRMTLM